MESDNSSSATLETRTETIGITNSASSSARASKQTMADEIIQQDVEYPTARELHRAKRSNDDAANPSGAWGALRAIKKTYDETVVKNAPQVASVESLLRSLAYFLPGKFKDSEFATETMFAGLNLLGMYHDSVLAKHFPTSATAAVWKQQHTTSGVVGIQSTPPPSLEMSLHNRYIRAGINDGQLYKRMSYGLSTLQFLQVVLEIWARKTFGENGRWRAIILIEAIKYVFLFLFAHMIECA